MFLTQYVYSHNNLLRSPSWFCLASSSMSVLSGTSHIVELLCSDTILVGNDASFTIDTNCHRSLSNCCTLKPATLSVLVTCIAASLNAVIFLACFGWQRIISTPFDPHTIDCSKRLFRSVLVNAALFLSMILLAGISSSASITPHILPL